MVCLTTDGQKANWEVWSHMMPPQVWNHIFWNQPLTTCSKMRSKAQTMIVVFDIILNFSAHQLSPVNLIYSIKKKSTMCDSQLLNCLLWEDEGSMVCLLSHSWE